jgi:integrase
VAKAYRLLKAIMTTAVEDGLVRRNPCRIDGAGIEKSPERQTATLDEVFAIASAMEPRYKALVLLATFASLRWGELMGLHRSDLDLTRRTVRVVRAVQELGAKQIVGRPKSDAGIRAVSFPRFIVPNLEWHLRVFAEKGKDGRVFVGPKGATPLRSNFQKFWARATEKACVPELHLHDLRHTGATYAAATGASTRELMKRLGHSTPRAALIYQHAVEERDHAIAAGLDDLIEEARKARERKDQQPEAEVGRADDDDDDPPLVGAPVGT